MIFPSSEGFVIEKLRRRLFFGTEGALVGSYEFKPQRGAV
jgi:hypothetical protein